jgi:hypothetical protein
MDLVTLPNWLWIAAFAGCFLFGGICAALLWEVVRVRPLQGYRDVFERDTLVCPPPEPLPPRPQSDTLISAQ